MAKMVCEERLRAALNTQSHSIVRREIRSAGVAVHENALAQRILSARGVKSKKELDFSLATLPSPDSLPDIKLAVDRLVQAKEKSEKVLVVGDYDCDGATSTALVVLALTAFGFKTIDYLVPNRFEFGYGLSPAIVDIAAERNADLLLTVDNGVASFDGVVHARKLGMDVLVTDHHLPPEELPTPVALVNPNLEGSTFPSKNLAGVGVAFFVMLALRARLAEIGDDSASYKLSELLDLVAIGTVADMVPLDVVNRTLVEQGIRRIRHRHTRSGVLALLEKAGRSPEELHTQDIGYLLGPRLNAAGRMQDISVGIECLLSSDPSSARKFAEELDDLNKHRRSVEKNMTDAAAAKLFDSAASEYGANEAFGVCLYESDWHQGVIGILAGRLKEKLYKPVVVFTDDDEINIKGSARSIPGVHIRDVFQRMLTQYEVPLVKFGGHAMAAGLTLPKTALDKFISSFDTEIRRILKDRLPKREWLTDGELDVGEIDLPHALLLERLMPWGIGFEAPLFDGSFHISSVREVGAGHAKLTVQPVVNGELAAGIPIEAIAFNQFSTVPENPLVQLVYSLAVNRYRNQQRLQFQVHHIEPKSG